MTIQVVSITLGEDELTLSTIGLTLAEERRERCISVCPSLLPTCRGRRQNWVVHLWLLQRSYIVIQRFFSVLRCSQRVEGAISLLIRDKGGLLL